MKYFIYRNTTIEPFFIDRKYTFSQYNDISEIPDSVDAYIWFYLVPLKADQTVLKEEISQYYKNIIYLIDRLPINKSFYIFTLDDYINTQTLTGNFEIINTIYNFNIDIVKLTNAHPNVRVVNFNEFTSRYSKDLLIDWKYFYISHTQINLKLIPDFNEWFDRQLNSIRSSRKKCMIIDLDNTIWGGGIRRRWTV
ncbi:MAG: hypothetical protein PHS04_09350 [Tissierellia bacterium]|nr:hypothetical protein [Tissierellia bacterium]